jgi:outer membrane protein, heavy metal efflux system
MAGKEVGVLQIRTTWQSVTFVGVTILSGCTLPAARNPSASVAPPADVAQAAPAQTPGAAAPYQVPPAQYEAKPVIKQTAYQALNDADDPFAGEAELPVERLVAEVETRNPSLQAAEAAWRSSAQRYPQAVSLDDPMFATMIGPAGVGMNNGGGWMVEASQKIPWAGKRSLRGSAASADADVMRGDIGDVRLRLTETTRTVFYDYYLVRRRMETLAATRRLLTQFREIAWNKYQVNQTTQQDSLQADVELASLESRASELSRDEKIAVARINTLLHREPNHPLPAPPSQLPVAGALLPAEQLQETAIQSRPDLYAAQARIRAEEANLALAYKEYYPDMNLVAKYDGFMEDDMRPQVGMEVNVPLGQTKRAAAVREASERLAQRKAERQERLDAVRYEVQTAADRAAQAREVIRIYEEKILPAAQRSAESALANYTSGKLDFLRLLDAERQVFSQQDMYYQAIAEYHRRLAELNRVVGKSPCGTL